MPPPTNRDLYIVLVDLKTSSRKELLDTLYTIKLYELMSASKSLFNKIYLVNSTHTSNSHNYKGIQLFDIGQGDSPIIPELPTETGQSDFVEAIRVAVTDLESDATSTNSKVITLKILFLTDLNSFQETKNSSKLAELINDLNKLDIFLYIVGADIDAAPPQALSSFKDVTEWMQKLCLNLPPSLNVVKNILQDSPNSVVCNYDIGLHLFYSYSHFKGRQPWNVPLDIGTMLNIEVSTIKISEVNAPINLKNSVNVSDGYKWVAEEEQDKSYDLRDTVTGIVRHGKFVPIENDAQFKVIGPRSFRLVFIASAEDVPEYFLNSDGSYAVLPTENQSDDFYTFFKTFVEELARQKLYVVARRVYNKDNNPQFVALIPRPDVKQACFVMCGLPYAEDIRYPYKEKPVEAAPKTEINQNVYDFLDGINVSGSKCQLEPTILAPRMMICPSALAIVNKVKEKLNLPGIEENKMGITDRKPFKEEKIKKEWLDREFEPISKCDDEANLADFNDVDDFTFE